ncbi:telomerase inhibitor [Diaporthe australafricana]|uniref:PinX1-related protein 1 n=1 Tax=Diaporthe australafricana TaxID=127596 RepID=A0ABR3WPV8_9PEZI
MGLAGAKNKKKWAKDPNNTAWSRNTDTFGHKILRSQGWAPGQYLGAENASHSEYYGAANASHIRAVLKDDSLGLGAKRNQGDECTGLDALQDLLSRLNGKSDESLGEEKKKREDLKINKYLHRKLGTVTFVYGGLLVGDKVQELADAMKDKHQEAAHVPGSEETSGESSDADKKEKKSKKRKAGDADGADSKKDKKSKKRKSEDADEESKSKRKEKKDKKRRKEKEAEDKDEDSSPEDADEGASDRKKARKEKKERRKKSKTENDDEDAESASDPKSKKSKKKRKADKEEPTPQPTVLSTPSASGTSTPSVPTRHLARSRFIAQKRAAVMDQAALNQIFMIKT